VKAVGGGEVWLLGFSTTMAAGAVGDVDIDRLDIVFGRKIGLDLVRYWSRLDAFTPALRRRVG
jgi:hypothetical protein